jgi:hypothetical protein
MKYPKLRILLTVGSLLCAFPGTMEDLECSSRGLCSETTGICKCLKGYASSNGTVGFVGSRYMCAAFLFRSACELTGYR